jgi:periplasmic protein TonB
MAKVPPLLIVVALIAGSSLGADLAMKQPAQEPTTQPQSDGHSSQGEAPQEQTPAGRVRLSSRVAMGLLIKRVDPEYPESARRDRIQGVVMFRAVITTSGEIADLEVVSGVPLLAKAAGKAVKQWKFKPYRLQGQPVEVETTIQVNFTLSGR